MAIKNYLETKLLRKKFIEMPLFHTTPFKNLDSISKSGLVPKYCRVFERDLIYLFYGRSSYGKDEDGQIRLDDSVLASCFGIYMYDLDEIAISKIYPFDSGSFKDDRFSPHVSAIDGIDNYEIPKGKVNLYIQEFFETEKNYIEGHGKDIFDTSEEVYSGRTYNLISDLDNPDFDTRGRTIELLYDKPIDLEKIRILVIHVRHETRPEVIRLKEHGDFKILTYDTDEVGKIRDIYTLIKNKVKEFVKETLREAL